MIVEIVGVASKDERYDRLALEFTRLLALAFTATAVLGVLGVVALVLLYPSAMTYLTKIFSPTFLPYALCIIVDAVLLVVYYYAWDAMQGRLKWLHIGIAALLNLVGTALMCIANMGRPAREVSTLSQRFRYLQGLPRSGMSSMRWGFPATECLPF